MKRIIASIQDDVAYAMYARTFEDPASPAIPYWTAGWEYCRVTAHHIQLMAGSLVCRFRGHTAQVEEQTNGRVDWYCPRCGQGGGGWF